MMVIIRGFIVSIVTGLTMLVPIEAQQAEPDSAPARLADSPAPVRVVRLVQDDSVRLTTRSKDDEFTSYVFDIKRHSMYVTVASTGLVTVVVNYSFTNPVELADVFPELKMDFDQFPGETSDGSQVELAVKVNSNYEFDNLAEFEQKLPNLFLNFDVLKDSEPTVSVPQLSFGGVTPRIIIQEEEEELPLIRIEPAQKKNGG